ncbi:hypothetical protein CN507_30010 [Bacillus cereus]|nr:hypothetical protein CN507_30010 [Bacillus cereus]
MFGIGNRKRIEYLENKVNQLTIKNRKLQEKLDEKRRLYVPNWRKEITVSPYIIVCNLVALV